MAEPVRARLTDQEGRRPGHAGPSVGRRPSRLISDGDIEVIVTAARTRPEKLGQPFTHWSLRKLAGYLVP